MREQSGCILVLGSTGTGKSTLIGLCTGEPVSTSGGSGECTLDIQEYRDEGDPTGPLWVDSVGFDGTDSRRSDEEAFQYILRFLQTRSIHHLVGVIWTVNPDDREATRLQEQAKLIDKFKEGEVWKNVIIVVKKTRGNARSDGAGALAAAGRYSDKDSIQTIGYALLDQLDDPEKSFWERQISDDRKAMGILTQSEAKVLIKAALKNLPPQLQVVFCNSKCTDCGVESDRRLFPLVCHTLKEAVHPEDNFPFHGGAQSLIHPSAGVARRHTGGVAYRKERTGGNRVTGRKYKEVPYMSCCNNDPSHPGCQVYHPCCQLPQGTGGCRTVFSCCGTDVSLKNPGCARQYPCCGGEERAGGCREQCSYCKGMWGQMDGEIECIGRSHDNVIEL